MLKIVKKSFSISRHVASLPPNLVISHLLICFFFAEATFSKKFRVENFIVARNANFMVLPVLLLGHPSEASINCQTLHC